MISFWATILEKGVVLMFVKDLYERSTSLEATGANEKSRIARWLEKR